MESASKTHQWNNLVVKRIDNVRLMVIAGLVLVTVLSGLSALDPRVGVIGSLLLLFLVLIIPRPILIVYGLTVLLPLTGGLARGAAVPFLRVGQALLVLGCILFVLAKPGRLGKLRFSAIDLAFALFLLTEAIFPVLALYYHGESINLTTTDSIYGMSPLQTLLGPIQYYLLYRIVVATISSQKHIIALLKLIFVTSIVVSIIGIAQKLSPSVNAFLATYYPTPVQSFVIAAQYQRITSTLQFYSGLGAYLTFTLILALACYTAQKHLNISPLLLMVTFLFDSIALVLTGTFAAWIGLAIGVVLVFLIIRRLPKTFIFVLIGIALAAIIFQTFLSSRLQDELGAGAIQGIVPQSLAFRIMLWQEIFLPAIGQSLLFGYGPSPAVLNSWPAEESQYFFLLLRGGIPYLLSYLLLMGVAAAVCWQHIKTKSEDPSRVIAIALLAILVVINIMNISGEYFTYIGGTQTIWTLLAIVVASKQFKTLELSTTVRRIMPGRWSKMNKAFRNSLRLATATTISSSAAETFLTREMYSLGSYSLIPNYTAPEMSLLYRPRPRLPWLNRLLDWRFVIDLVVVGLGSTISRVLGLLFSTLLAHFLLPDDFGFFRYAVTLAGIISIVASTYPNSIARFLAAHPNDAQARDRYFSNGMLGVAILLALSLLISVPILWLFHALDLGTISCIVGLTGFYCYLALARGLSSAWKMGLTYIINNVALVIALIVVFGFFRIHTATVAIVIWGLANLAPIVMELFRPMALHFRLNLVSRTVLLELARFAVPMIISSGAFSIWVSIDLLTVQNFYPHASGSYAAAKTLAQIYVFIPSAITLVLMPRVAGQGLDKSKRYLIGGLLAALLLSLFGFVIIGIWGQKLITLAFGPSYLDAYLPLLMLSVGMCITSVNTVLEGFLIGRGQPHLAAHALLVALISTSVTCFWLTFRLGALGASLAFTIGAALAMVVMLSATWRFLHKEEQAAKHQPSLSNQNVDTTSSQLATNSGAQN